MRKFMTAAALTAMIACAAAGSAYAKGWVSENGSWRYANDDNGGSWLSSGWYWLDGDNDGVAECYYFNADGYMLANTVTPDNYRVNADGAWIDDAGNVQTRTAFGPVGSTQPSQSGDAAGGSQQNPQVQGPMGPQGPVTPESAEKADVSETQNNAEVVETKPEEEAAPAGRYIDLTKPMVALTYDDGPQTGAGNRILDTLANYGAKATFFLVGDRCASRAAEVQRMVAEGHEVGNHTYQHKYLNKLGAEQIRNQIDQGSAAIAAAGGGTPALVRLPGGNKNSTVLANVNYPMIQWSIDTRDWEHRNAQKTINEVLSKVRDGDIVLMHELYDATATATETIVPELVARGYQLVTVSEMAQAKGVQLLPGQLYYNFR